MFKINIADQVPGFILNDRNGYALARALEAGLQMFNDTIRESLERITDYDKMPEWFLDELAWETNCLYDYGADIETKRRWIIDAIPMYRLYGTPQAVYEYIGSYFDSIELEEYWQYGGEPYHFRVTVEGTWTPANEAWARRAIDTAKNVRSVLDALQIGTRGNLAMMAEGEVLARFRYPMASEGQKAGTWPDIAKAVKVENVETAVETQEEQYRITYIMTGTVPDVNTMGVVETGEAGVESTAEAYKIRYPATGEEQRTGTHPDIAKAAEVEDVEAAVETQEEHYRTSYIMTGTVPDVSTMGVAEEGKAGIESTAQEHKIHYMTAGEEQKAGTYPDNAKGVEVEDAEISLTGEVDGKKQKYPMPKKEQ